MLPLLASHEEAVCSLDEYKVRLTEEARAGQGSGVADPIPWKKRRN